MDMNLSKFWVIVKDRAAWCAIVHEMPKSWTRLMDRTINTHTHTHTHTHTTESLCCPLETKTTLLINYSPI